MKNRYPLLAARIFNAPHMIEQAKALEIVAGLEPYFLGQALPPKPEAYADGGEGDSESKPYQVTPSGTAIISIRGTLVQRSSWMGAWSGLTGYDRIRGDLDAALDDPEVRAVLFDIDSPGGEVAGSFALAKAIQAAGDIKPVWAVANERAYSAAYLLACAAQKLYAPASAGVGSIGVIALHLDRSKAERTAGLKYTAIYKGARKNDFSPHEPLSDEAMGVIGAQLDQLYSQFVEFVARARGLSPQEVAQTEAGCFLGPEALELGLIDGVMEFEEVLAELDGLQANGPKGGAYQSAQIIQPKPDGESMEKKSSDAGMTAAAPPAKAAENGPESGAPNPEALAQARREGEAEASQRICAILESEEAQGKTQTALQLAKTGMGLDDAKKVLATVPSAQPENQAADHFSQAMAKIKNPDIGPDDGEASPDDPAAVAASIMADAKMAGIA